MNTSQLSSSSAEEIEYSEEEVKRAEEFKAQGNEFFKRKCFVELMFKEGHFDKALDMYSEAIFCKVPKSKKAVYYSNRAFTNIKLENYAIALFGKGNVILNLL